MIGLAKINTMVEELIKVLMRVLPFFNTRELSIFKIVGVKDSYYMAIADHKTGILFPFTLNRKAVTYLDTAVTKALLQAMLIKLKKAIQGSGDKQGSPVNFRQNPLMAKGYSSVFTKKVTVEKVTLNFYEWERKLITL